MKKLNWLLIFLLPALIGMSCNPGTNPPDFDGNFTSDTTLPADKYSFESLTVSDGVTVSFSDEVEITVTGDADIKGEITSDNGKLTLLVGGSLNLSGVLDVQGVSNRAPAAEPENASFNDQISGILMMSKADVTMTTEARITTVGPLVITDSEESFASTPQDIYDDTNTDNGNLDTLVPLPDDTPTEAPAQAADRLTPAQGSHLVTISGEVTIKENSNLAGLATGARVVFLNFNDASTLSLENLTFNETVGTAGFVHSTAIETLQDDERRGRNGIPGVNINASNPGGSVNLSGLTINLDSGTDGESLSETGCLKVFGGNGGEAGNFRASALNGVNLNGLVTLIPGRSGNGGSATVTADDNCDVAATGGNGANNKKSLRVRGNVNGISNLAIGPITAGNGGNATATAVKGEDGAACTEGEKGGGASATAGEGGDATLNLNGLPVTADSVTAGDGGVASATGGDGGKGGDTHEDCGTIAGDGGNAGKAEAEGGDGGNASNRGGSAVEDDGDGGDATANGGLGGLGGNACPPNPAGTGGEGGNGGNALARAGSAVGNGTDGTNNGMAGNGNNGGDGVTPGGQGTKGNGTNIPDGANGNPGQACPTQQVALTIIKDGSGTGTVAGSGIDCGNVCTLLLDPGDAINLTATPDEDSTFEGWTATDTLCSGKDGCNFTMPNKAVTVTAVFERKAVESFTLTVLKDGAGTGTVADGNVGINCGSVCTVTLAAGTPIGLSANPDPGSVLISWAGPGVAACGNSSVCNTTMPASDLTITVTFELEVQNFNLTVIKDGTGSGSVGGSGIDCSAVCTVALPAGSAVSLAATADAGSTFVGWTASAGECAGVADCSFNMPASNVTVTATFNRALASFMLDFSVLTPGVIPSGTLVCIPLVNEELGTIGEFLVEFIYGALIVGDGSISTQDISHPGPPPTIEFFDEINIFHSDPIPPLPRTCNFPSSRDEFWLEAGFGGHSNTDLTTFTVFDQDGEIIVSDEVPRDVDFFRPLKLHLPDDLGRPHKTQLRTEGPGTTTIEQGSFLFPVGTP